MESSDMIIAGIPCLPLLFSLLKFNHLCVCLFHPLPVAPRQMVRRMQEKLSLQESKNTFALYEQNELWEQPVAGSALIADILTRFE